MQGDGGKRGGPRRGRGGNLAGGGQGGGRNRGTANRGRGSGSQQHHQQASQRQRGQGQQHRGVGRGDGGNGRGSTGDGDGGRIRPVRQGSFREDGSTSAGPSSSAPSSSGRDAREEKEVDITKLAPFTSYYHRLREFKHQHDMRKWVLSALVEPNIEDVVIELSRSEQVAKLRQILSCPFKTGATDSRNEYSFERLIVPLCTLLTRDSFANAPLARHVQEIYHVVASEGLFFANVVKCVEQVAKSGLANHVNRNPRGMTEIEIKANLMQQWNPSNWMDVLKPVASLFYLLLTRASSIFAGCEADIFKANNTFAQLEAAVEALSSRLPPGNVTEKGQLEKLEAVLNRTQSVVFGLLGGQQPQSQALVGPSGSSSRDKRRNKSKRNMAVKFRKPVISDEMFRQMAEEPPGSLREAGPRHDNDEEDFRRVSVLPTEDEMICTTPPYLPRWGERTQSGRYKLARQDAVREAARGFDIPPVSRHLDAQFRLLREDCLAGFRQSLHAFLTKYELADMEELKRRGIPNANRQDDLLRQLTVYRHVQVDELRSDLRKGVCMMVSFDQLEDLRGNTAKEAKTKRESFWGSLAGSRRLQLGSLACLAVGVRKSDAAQQQGAPQMIGAEDEQAPPKLTAEALYFATITMRNDKDLTGPARCKVGLTMLDPNDVAELIARKSRMGDTGEDVLLQLRGHFFPSYSPVLRALQVHSETTFPFVDVLIGGDDRRDADAVHPLKRRAAFLSDHTEYDLSVLHPPPLRRDPTLRMIRPAYQRETLQELLRASEEQRISLDSTQCEALAAALGRQVTLIQGPPGTGKTYVGVQIVLSLLQNSGTPVSEAWQQWDRTEGDGQLRCGIGPVQREHDVAARPSLHPILCICYTNHALDQFLEGLIDNGVDIDSVVRAGGMSKSERLRGRMLNDLSFQIRMESDGARKAFGKEKARSDPLQKKIDERSRDLLHARINRGVLFRWLKESKFYAYYKAIAKSLPEGFKNAGGDEELVRYWLGYQVVRQPPEPQQSETIAKSNAFEALAEKDQKEQKKDNKKKGKQRRNNEEEKEAEEEEWEEEVEDEIEKGETGELQEISLTMAPEGPCRGLEILIRDDAVWGMTFEERRLLWSYWEREFRIRQQQLLAESIDAFGDCTEKIQEVDDLASLSVLKNAKVIGFTTTGCAKYQRLLAALRPKVVICEEAGEVLESHVLASLTDGTEQLILIGDHQQLRPKVEEYYLSRDSGRKFDLDVSLFERLVDKYGPDIRPRDTRDMQTELDSFASFIRNWARGSNEVVARPREPPLVCTLDTQRRMRPEIADLLRATLYPQLRDGDKVRAYPALKGFAANLWFFDHNHAESKDEGMGIRSYTNLFEAQMVTALVRHAVLQGYQPNEIAVLTPYLGQLMLIRRKVAESNLRILVGEKDMEQLLNTGNEVDETDGASAPSTSEGPSTSGRSRDEEVRDVSLKDRIRLATVDNFQGEEAEVIIISTVRCNRSGTIGFLKQSNRVNVMISRAKHGMIILGSSHTVRAKRGRGGLLFHKVLDLLEEKQAIGPHITLRCGRHPESTRAVANPEEIRKFAPDGGCSLECGMRLKCGHVCPRRCHPDDPDHRAGRCTKPCTKLLPCGHPCTNPCYFPCGPCKQVVSGVSLPCGHVANNIQCSKLQLGPEKIKCSAQVEALMPLCGHVGSLKCHQKRELAEFIHANQRELESGQLARFLRKNKKEQAPIFMCTRPCGRRQEGCDHPCQRPCGSCAEATVAKTGRYLAERDPKASKFVHAGECKASKCDRGLFCGHFCKGKGCHSAGRCPPCNQQCLTRCVHSSCGRPCHAPCPACAEDCTWQCEHRGGCSLPCGSPCDRLPCDQRCAKLLKCGHRCPGVCGEETCPTPEYCRECCSESQKELQVDLLMMASLGDHDPDESPLVVLKCGHAFTIETLDGLFKMQALFYEHNGRDWVGLKSLRELSDNDLPQVSCPHCRSPITNVRRYGRPLNCVSLRYAQRKFLAAMTIRARDAEKQFSEVEKKLEKRDMNKQAGKKNNPKEIQESVSKALASVIKTLRDCNTEAPTMRIYEMECAKMLRRLPAGTQQEVNSGEEPCSSTGTALKAEIQLEPSLPLSPTAQPRILLLLAGIQGVALVVLLAPEARLRQVQAKKPKQPDNEGKNTELEDALLELFNLWQQGVSWTAELGQLCVETKSHLSALKGALKAARLHVAYACALEKAREAFAGLAQFDMIATKMNQALEEAERCVDGCRDGDQDIQAQRKVIQQAIETLRKRAISNSKEELKSVFLAMGADVGTGTGSFGGHWYQCPNGHIYTIGECGGAMQQSRCPECGAVVGGANHALATGNRPAHEFLDVVRGGHGA